MLYILIILLSAIAQFLGPWWLMALVCFALCFWKSSKAASAFGVAFLAISTLWIGFATFQNIANEGIISQKIADIFKLPNAFLLITVTGLIGGIVGGFSGLAGYYCRKALA